MQQQNPQDEVEKRHRVLMIIWAALLIAVALYAVVGYFAKPDAPAEGGENNLVLLTVFLLVGISSIGSSLVLKSIFLKQAAERQRLDSVQTAYIVAFALAEMPAIIGLVGLFATGESFSYIMFAVAVVGLMLHMPRRDHLLAAAYQRTGNQKLSEF